MLTRTFLALVLACAYIAHAEDKPDEFAHHHYSAKSKKSTVTKTVASNDLDAQVADVARKAEKPMISSGDDVSGVAIAPPAPKAFSATPVVQPVTTFPRVALCRLTGRAPAGGRHSNMVRQYLISDSDGVDACESFGGEIVAGREEDRSLTDVKEQLKQRR